jgi:hypothetical protein
MKREPFSPHEHLACGSQLYRIERQLNALAFAAQDAYGLAGYKRFERVLGALEKLRSDMDDIVCREIKDRDICDGVPVTRVYYGWQRDGFQPAAMDNAKGRAELREAAEVIAGELSGKENG